MSIPGRENQLSWRILSKEKVRFEQGGANQSKNLTCYIRFALKASLNFFRDHKIIRLSARDSVLLHEILQNPPKPNAILISAARDLPKF